MDCISIDGKMKFSFKDILDFLIFYSFIIKIVINNTIKKIKV